MFDHFSSFTAIPELGHVISTRAGGVSTGAFAALNLGYHVGDEAAYVTENRRRLARAAGYAPDALVAAQQVHGTALAWVGEAERGRGAYSWADALAGTDGLLVSAPGIPVIIQVADCMPVLIVDPRQHVLALLHAGWRGALGHIAGLAVQAMVSRAGSHPPTLQVGLGPALCPACLEVSEEIGAAAEGAFGPDAVHRASGTPHLDFAAMLTADLARLGVAPTQITRHPQCTRCHPDRFFSHRGQAGCAGRQAMVAWWRA